MKNRILFMATWAIMLLSAGVISAQKISGKGPVVTETIEMSQISSIGLGISANVFLTQGNKQSVKIIGQQNIIDLIEKDVDGESWNIKVPNNTRYSTNEKLEIHITLKTLESLNIGGSGSIKGENAFRNLDDLKLNIGGSGSIDLNATAEKLDCNIGGSGSIKLEGSARSIKANIGGSGSVDAINFKVANAKVNAAGSGSVHIDVSDQLSASIVGSGGVRYRGNPEIDKTVMGSGRVKAY